jgi:imidazolonepropionase-like amidohydrolase
MTPPRAALAITFLLALGACASRSDPPGDPSGPAGAPALLLRDVTLIDGTGAPPRRHVSVLARSGIVHEIGDAATLKAPPGARVVEGRGRFLIPGLWDMHVHLTYGDEKDLGVLVANGVTSVRDMGGDLSVLDAWRARIEAGELVGPRIFRAGPTVDGPKPGIPHRLTVTNAQEAREAVARLQELGVEVIKIHNAVPRDAFFALAGEARERGIAFAGHVPMTVEPAEAAEAGQRSVEHIATLIEGTYMTRFPNELAAYEGMPRWVGEEVPRLAEIFARQGTWFVPTIIAYDLRARRGELAVNPDPRLRYASPSLRKYWDAVFPVTDRDRDPKAVALRRRFVELGLEMTRRMHEAGVAIAVGSDLAGRDVLPGFSVHDEIALLAAAGLSPLEALRAATAEGARLLNVAESHGTIARAKTADLVLLEADPLADIRNTGRIAAVVLRGRLLERKDLDRLLEQASEGSDRKQGRGDAGAAYGAAPRRASVRLTPRP